MTTEGHNWVDSPTQRAIDELTGLVRRRYPSASFTVGVSPEDPCMTGIIATVDVDDPDDVVDLVIDRMLELQIEEQIPVHLIPVRTPGRVAALLKQQHTPIRRLPPAPATRPESAS